MVRVLMMMSRTLLPVPWCWRRARAAYAALWMKFGEALSDPPVVRTDLDPASRAALIWRARGAGWRDYVARLDPEVTAALDAIELEQASRKCWMKRSVEGKNEMMITKDSIVGRNADGRVSPSWRADAASGLRPCPMRRRLVPRLAVLAKARLATRRTTGRCALFRKEVLAAPIRSVRMAHTGMFWRGGKPAARLRSSRKAIARFFCCGTPLQSGEGRPQSAITADPITRSAVSGPEAAAVQDAHRQMFDRIMDHNSKKPPAARRALAAIKRGTDTMESINAENRKFWGGKK